MNNIKIENATAVFALLYLIAQLISYFSVIELNFFFGDTIFMFIVLLISLCFISMNQGKGVELDSHVKKLIWRHNVEMTIVKKLHNDNKTPQEIADKSKLTLTAVKKYLNELDYINKISK